MTLALPIEIDILAFFKEGKFDYLKLGQTKEWILNNFPDPDGFNTYGEEIVKSNIWCYGKIELHFNENKLFLIFSDYIFNLTGGPSLHLKKWILNDPALLTLSYVIEKLNQEHIDFNKRYDQICDMVKLHLISSGVELSFLNEEKDQNLVIDPNNYQLVAFSLLQQ